MISKHEIYTVLYTKAHITALNFFQTIFIWILELHFVARLEKMGADWESVGCGHKCLLAGMNTCKLSEFQKGSNLQMILGDTCSLSFGFLHCTFD
jgi:hypothetical protein